MTTGKDAEVGTVSVDVPEIGSQEVAGEWLIPNGECLLVSFGAYTVADKDGKAVVKERLAIVDAEGTSVGVDLPIAGPGVVVPPPALSSSPARCRSSPRPCLSSSTRTLQRKRSQDDLPVPKVAMPVPAVPSRSFPQGIHADGKPADLPELPEDEPAIPTMNPPSRAQARRPRSHPSRNQAPARAPVQAWLEPWHHAPSPRPTRTRTRLSTPLPRRSRRL